MRCLLPLFLCLALSAVGQSLVWRITPADGGAPSYVLGTVHSRDARAFTHVPMARAVMERVDVVAGELDLSDPQANTAGMLGGLMLPAGTDPETLYGKRRYKKLRTALQERMGPTAPMLMRMRPFYLMGALAEQDMRNDSTQVLDQYLQQLALARGLQVLGIETMAEQLAAVNEVPLKEQADMLYEQVKDKKATGSMERMMELYAAGDLAGLDRLVNTSGASAGFNAAVMHRRNLVMVHRMDSLMRGGRRYLFAVGAAHLSGAEAVLAGLKRQGYRVEAVLREDDLN